VADAPSDSIGARLARYYDLDLQTGKREQPDIELYRTLAETARGPILELAVGTGRIAASLVAPGRAITGVDLDAHMLARARQRGPEVELIEADITAVRLRRRFALVILGLNSLVLLAPEAQLSALATMAAHLDPGGRAALDVWLPSADDLASYDRRVMLDWVRTDPETGDRVAKSTAARYDPADRLARITTYFDAVRAGRAAAQRTERLDVAHLVGAAELAEMVERVGLTVIQAAGDYDLSPLRGDSERVVLLCGLR
jgi:trans-aconitate methyltransferase